MVEIIDSIEQRNHTEGMKGLAMGKRMQLTTAPAHVGFNQRLAALRKAAGFTQLELTAELEISQRMIACDERAGASW